jgi:hypothetical protein
MIIGLGSNGVMRRRFDVGRRSLVHKAAETRGKTAERGAFAVGDVARFAAPALHHREPHEAVDLPAADHVDEEHAAGLRVRLRAGTVARGRGRAGAGPART